ncbi:MAG TPA: DUF58 domain-containing protein [Urbifossiella sp.]|jgi:uncharacterized protein (DUF58 family)
MKPSTAGMPTRGRFRLTSEGLVWLAAVAALGFLGWLKSLNLLLLLAYLMMALLVLNGFLARRQVLRIHAKRVPLPPVFAGEAVRTTVELHNAATTLASVILEEGSVVWNVVGLPGDGTIECTDLRRFGRRGRRSAPPIVVASASPFGLLRFDIDAESSGELVVLPNLGQADSEGMRRWILRQAGGEGQSRKALRRATTDLADIRGIRPYRAGDGIRSIHWRSSARRRELMVREYDAAPSPNLLIVVEPFLPANPTPDDSAKFEAALSLATTMIQEWRRASGTHVALVIAGTDPVISTIPTDDLGMRGMLIPLADAVGSSDIATMEPRFLGRGLGRSARVVVSSRPNSPLAAALERSTGKSFLAIDAAQPLPWYQPPIAPEG